ncbi:DedA family protein, partial [Pseudomonas aeruginosa]|nr:DedA family protein [Pseudomonas aeruginosa]
MLTDWAAYAGLFLSAFGSATLLPLQSVAWLLALAIVGNVLGSWVNW